MSSPNFRLSGGSLDYWITCNNFKRYCTLPYCVSVAISCNDPVHGKLHHATKFHSVMWFPYFQLPGPSLSWKMSKFRGKPKNGPSMAILGSDPIHGTVHHLTIFEADRWNAPRTAVMSSLGLCPSLFWTFQSAVVSAKFGRAQPFLIVICFIILCIIPPNFRPIAEILKASKR